MEPLKRFVFQTKNRQKYLTVHLSISFLFLSLLHAVRISVPFFRGEASRFCCSWVFFVCVAYPTHNFLSFSSFFGSRQQSRRSHLCWVTLKNFSRSASPVRSEWFPFEKNFSFVTSTKDEKRAKKSANKNRSTCLLSCKRARRKIRAQWLEFTHAVLVCRCEQVLFENIKLAQLSKLVHKT